MKQSRAVDSETTARMQTPLRSDRRPTVSYLVRFWLESHETAGTSSLSRGYVRDLRTGEEHYFGDPQDLSGYILRRLQTAHQAEVVEGGPDEIESAIG